MFKDKISIFLILGIFTISSALILYALYVNQRSHQQLISVIDSKLTLPPINSSAQNILSLDEQIRQARRGLQQASFRIDNLKNQISIHANNAANQRTISSAQRLLDDIAKNSDKVVEQNREIQENILELTSLYQQKVEDIYKARGPEKKSGLGLSFWAGIVGLVASISGIILAWRKDRRELVELTHKIKQTGA